MRATITLLCCAAVATACTFDDLGRAHRAVESGDPESGDAGVPDPPEPDAAVCQDCEAKRCECINLDGKVEELQLDIGITVQNEVVARGVAAEWGRVWSAAVNAQQGILDNTFGPDDRLKATAISIDLVLDAIVVGKVYKVAKCGVEGGVNMCLYPGAVRKSVAKKLLREVVTKSAEAGVNRSFDAICEIADTGSWEWRHLIPFMSAVDTYFECTTADDKIRALGLEAQRAMLMKQRWLDEAQGYVDERERLLEELEDAVEERNACWQELSEMTCCPCEPEPES